MFSNGIDKQAAWKRIMKLDAGGKPIWWNLVNRDMWEGKNGAIWDIANGRWLLGEGSKASMRWADLSKPINERLASVVGYGDPKAWLKEFKKNKHKYTGDYISIVGKPRGMSGEQDYFEKAYVDYARRVLENNPKYSKWIADVNKMAKRRKFIDSVTELTPAEKDADYNLNSITIRAREPLRKKMHEIAEMPVIPTLTEYESYKPFVSTHHMANPRASVAAAKLAETHPEGLIPSVTSRPTYKRFYNPNHRVVVPGSAPRTQEEIDAFQRLDEKGLGNSPDYEATFGSSYYPNARVTYTTPNKTSISELGITDDQIAEYAGTTPKTLQSANRSVIYKGSTRANHMPLARIGQEARDADLNAISKYLPPKSIRAYRLYHDIAPDQEALERTRWYTPWAHMAGGYAFDDFDAPLVKLNSEQLKRLRELYKSNVQSFRDEVQNYIKTVHQNLEARPDIIKHLPSLKRKQYYRALARDKDHAARRKFPDPTLRHVMLEARPDLFTYEW